ncbi:DUF6783 domain-containing protein [Peribacillus frigoritolerans]|uniref:DUF6783 domain-containing protein n=1 Tax=Peribacillus frigoritolerans TaxID=450367 RepID=UPI0035CCF284
MFEEEILYCVYFQINHSIIKNYYTRWVHKEQTAEWAISLAESHYKTDKSKFKDGAPRVSDERGVS